MLHINFITDYVCPYCLVAKEALHRALNKLGMEAHIVYQPHELTPAPRERVDTYHDEVRKAHYQILTEPCRQMGIDMKLPPRVIPRPYTRLAFEAWLHAGTLGLDDAWSERMYRYYWAFMYFFGSLCWDG